MGFTSHRERFPYATCRLENRATSWVWGLPWCFHGFRDLGFGDLGIWGLRWALLRAVKSTVLLKPGGVHVNVWSGGLNAWVGWNTDNMGDPHRYKLQKIKSSAETICHELPKTTPKNPVLKFCFPTAIAAMSTALQISIHFSVLNTISDDPTKRKSFFVLKSQQPINGFSPPRIKLKALGGRCSLWRESIEKDGFLMRKEKNQKRVVLVRVNRGFGFGGGGGGGRDNSNTARVLGNLALAIGLTYLSMTGQLGWVLDAIVSVWVSFSVGK